MISVLPVVTGLFSLLALSASGLIGTHLLPPWLQASLLRLRAVDNSLGDEASLLQVELSGPEAPLLQRLKNVEPEGDPETTHALHAAIANVLQASGTQSQQALHHLEAARDAAARGNDPDSLLMAHIKVAEAYIEEGRALDSQRELAVASGVLADHFTEHVAKLNRGRGRAKFELGWTESALGYFEQAEKNAVQPEDKVHVACDIALARACLGQASKSLQPLRQALEVLQAIRKAGPDGGMPAAMHTALTADVHFRLAELFHSGQSAVLAKEHYTKSLQLQQKMQVLKPERVAAIKQGIANLELGTGPELRCPTFPRPPWEKGAPQNMQGSAFSDRINLLLSERKYDLAESELKTGLHTHRTEGPYKNLDAAVALRMLGNLYRQQDGFPKAAKHFRQALHAAIACCGAEHQEAKAAYEGLQDVKWKLAYAEQRVAAAAISEYFRKSEKVGVSAGSPEEKEEIINLLTYSKPLVIA
jgi:tetratricopeptide (TPR) repeat protein